MGHNHLGRLPRTPQWEEVLAYLDGTDLDPIELAARVIQAAEHRLRLLKGDPGLGYCAWFLVRLPLVARGPAFDDELHRLAIDVPVDPTPLTFIAAVGERIESHLAALPPSGHLGEMAALAVRVALADALGRHGQHLFLHGMDAIRDDLAALDTPHGFGELMHSFCADFLARALQAIVDRELAQHIGETRAFATLNDSLAFMRALEGHAHHAAGIAERFAGDWYDKHRWETDHDIGLVETEGFVAHVLDKLADELKLQAATS